MLHVAATVVSGCTPAVVGPIEPSERVVQVMYVGLCGIGQGALVIMLRLVADM